jgi:hypothetical protein
MEHGRERDRFRRLVRPARARADWFSRTVGIVSTSLILLYVLHVGITIYLEEAKPDEICGPCVWEAANPGSRMTRCFLSPANRTCPTCGHEWRAYGRCFFRPVANFVEDLFP